MNSRRIATSSSSAAEEQKGSPKAGSGEYRLRTFELGSTQNIEVGLSVCRGASLTNGEENEAGGGLRQELNAIADERGLLVLTDSLIPVGTRVALEIRLSAWTKLCVFGHVRWHGRSSDAPAAMGIGIAFEDLPTAARTQLMAHLGVEPREATLSDTPGR